MFRFAILIGCVFSAAITSAANTMDSCQQLSLMPYPAKVECSDQFINTAQPMTIQLKGKEQYLSSLIAQFVPKFEKITQGTLGEIGLPIIIEVQSELPLHRDSEQLTSKSEAYQLTINQDAIHIDAATHVGAKRALMTLYQLVDRQTLPVVTVIDEPRFGWRGLLLDSVRHFFSVETIKRQIDGMAFAKLNVLHWHLTDDQGWRLQSETYPKLHQSNADGHYYTKTQIKDVITYAAQRGIEVMPEIDMPGHASAIAVAYPELMSAPGPYNHEIRWGVHKPLLDPTNAQVYRFAEAILGEVKQLFPFDYVHIGGDEVDPEHWLTNRRIQQFMQNSGYDSPEQLHAYFNQRLSKILNKLDRKMMGWDEVLHPDLPITTAVQSWRGPDALGLAAKAGHPALLSTGFYLDQPQYASYHYRVKFLPTASPSGEVGKGEQAISFKFEMPRKRGSAISGYLTIIGSDDKWRGFVDFRGKSRAAVKELSVTEEAIGFKIDTWMGPVTARIQRYEDRLGGDMVVGNAPYALKGWRVDKVPEAMMSTELSQQQSKNILGGEIALWSELIDENTIDLRLWPRALAVAERMWSDKSLRDEQSMYDRLQAVSLALTAYTTLQFSNKPSLQFIEPLGSDLDFALAMVSRSLEPAHYYHRHHEKSANESYSRQDRLDRLVDILPSESLPAAEFANAINRLIANTSDPLNFKAIERYVRDADIYATELIASNALTPSKFAEVRRQALRVQAFSTIGSELVQAIKENRKISGQRESELLQQLRALQSIEDEIVVAPAYALEQLLYMTSKRL